MFLNKAVPEPVIVPISQINQPNQPKVKDLRILRFEEFLIARSLAPKSQKAYQQDIKYFLDWCDTSWIEVSPRQIAQFKNYLLRTDEEARVLKDATVKRVLGTLKNFYNWMFRSGYVKLDPTVGVELPHTTEPGANNLSLQVVEQIFEVLETIKYPERNLALVGLLLHGLRASEACSLNVGDYDGARVKINQAKAGSVGTVPLEEWCKVLVDNYLDWKNSQIGNILELESPLFISCSNRNTGERISYDTINKLCKKITSKTGFKFNAHQLRHTFATNLVLSGVNPYHAMTLMRHKSVSNFRRYTKAADTAAAEADFSKVSQNKSILRCNYE